jgi:hypothetical protein
MLTWFWRAIKKVVVLSTLIVRYLWLLWDDSRGLAGYDRLLSKLGDRSKVEAHYSGGTIWRSSRCPLFSHYAGITRGGFLKAKDATAEVFVLSCLDNDQGELAPQRITAPKMADEDYYSLQSILADNHVSLIGA